MRVLDNHRAGDRLRIVNRLLKFFLSDVLDVLVDGQDKVLARVRLRLDIGEPPPFRVDRDEHLSRTSAQLVVELVLNPALAGILHPNRTQHLCGEITRGIKTLRLLLEVNSLQLQRIDAFDSFVVGLTRHPAERLVRAAVRQHYVVIIARDACDKVHRGRQVFDFSGHREGGIDQHRHRELVTGAVVNHPALGGQRNGTLLLVSSLLDEFAVIENLQDHETPANGEAPQKKEGPQQVEPGVLARCSIRRTIRGTIRGHEYPRHFHPEGPRRWRAEGPM